MSYEQVISKIVREEGVEHSTMMSTPCIRYKGQFMSMMFDRENALIIKVSADRVNELIAQGRGLEFNFTKKRFKEWVLIPLDYEADYESYIYEALEYAKTKA
ncbi:hypothetical protein [Aliikangiella coralliicola]|uniref:MmcQ/YjbR family DNA-binding protein n=1 Tax=Aliikangiella coralliicola TaxID=2592383 RepID=A0A545UG58_9GAMM|nr:hypothetical protein [Aliikangiella coralliicola]TQV88458.1 hypothetical protein FLL46_08005 [Aliikangiella coralliicola]